MHGGGMCVRGQLCVVHPLLSPFVRIPASRSRSPGLRSKYFYPLSHLTKPLFDFLYVFLHMSVLSAYMHTSNNTHTPLKRARELGQSVTCLPCKHED